MVLYVYIFFLSFFIRIWRNGYARDVFGRSYWKHLSIIILLISLSIIWEVIHQILETPAGQNFIIH